MTYFSRALFVLFILIPFSACSKNEVGDVGLGILTTKDIKIDRLVDPKVPGVTCHIASIEANLSFADPSNMSISCRQTGPITTQMLQEIDISKSGEVVFKKSKSIFFKNLKVRRIYDPETNALLYLSYSTKELRGSFKHSLSTVPLFAGPLGLSSGE